MAHIALKPRRRFAGRLGSLTARGVTPLPLSNLGDLTAIGPFSCVVVRLAHAVLDNALSFRWEPCRCRCREFAVLRRCFNNAVAGEKVVRERTRGKVALWSTYYRQAKRFFGGQRQKSNTQLWGIQDTRKTSRSARPTKRRFSFTFVCLVLTQVRQDVSPMLFLRLLLC